MENSGLYSFSAVLHNHFMKLRIRAIFKSLFPLFLMIIFSLACTRKDPGIQGGPAGPGSGSSPAAAEVSVTGTPEADSSADREIDPDREAFVEDFWRWIFGEAGLPESIARRVASSALESPAFVMELLFALQQDPYTYLLVDKQNPLPLDYEPDDLVPLRSSTYRMGRDGLSLRRIAADALEEMAAAAARDGIVFTIGSSYRSGTYQAEVYERWVRQLGREAADRVSARPGHSQHQLGLVVDFAPIDNSFAQTPASQWLAQNASRFGWSLSYPEGYEHITGYSWESWHYRYAGKDLAAFIDRYFDGIQQYALKFISAWQEQAGN